MFARFASLIVAQAAGVVEVSTTRQQSCASRDRPAKDTGADVGEGREVLSDGLFRMLSLDPLCSEAPARRAAVWIEHIDGIVGDALDRKLKIVLLCASDRPLRLYVL